MHNGGCHFIMCQLLVYIILKKVDHLPLKYEEKKKTCSTTFLFSVFIKYLCSLYVCVYIYYKYININNENISTYNIA